MIPIKSLHTDLNPETFYFRLVVTEGHTEIVQTTPPPLQSNSFYLNMTDNTLDLPCYPSRDITVTSKLMGSGYIAKVLVSGLDVCCKIGTAQSFKAVQREYDCLRQITISKSGNLYSSAEATYVGCRWWWSRSWDFRGVHCEQRKVEWRDQRRCR